MGWPHAEVAVGIIMQKSRQDKKTRRHGCSCFDEVVGCRGDGAKTCELSSPESFVMCGVKRRSGSGPLARLFTSHIRPSAGAFLNDDAALVSARNATPPGGHGYYCTLMNGLNVPAPVRSDHRFAPVALARGDVIVRARCCGIV